MDWTLLDRKKAHELVDRRLTIRALEEAGGDLIRAAALMGVSLPTMKKLRDQAQPEKRS